MKLIFDFSHQNPDINWDQIKQISDLDGVVLKVSEGITVQDPMFHVRFNAASSHNVLIKGLYHFYHPKDDPNQQADNYIKTRESSGSHKDIYAIVDLEWCEASNEWLMVPEPQRYADLKLFISRLEAEGYLVMIYSSHAFMSQYLPSADFLSIYPLWIAWYEASPPMLPSPWTKWTWWQYTASGNVSGVSGPTDISYVNGEA